MLKRYNNLICVLSIVQERWGAYPQFVVWRRGFLIQTFFLSECQFEFFALVILFIIIYIKIFSKMQLKWIQKFYTVYLLTVIHSIIDGWLRSSASSTSHAHVRVARARFTSPEGTQMAAPPSAITTPVPIPSQPLMYSRRRSSGDGSSLCLITYNVI